MVIIGVLSVAMLVAVIALKDEVEELREAVEELAEQKGCLLNEAGDASQVQWDPIGHVGGRP